jgi:hypothetical protein
MTDFLTNGKPVPEGVEFLRAAWEMEDRCEHISDDVIAKAGVKAPECLHKLGTMLSRLDRLSGCFWGCRGGDHRIEFIAGRVSSSARAALRLLRLGFYDESLAITRSIGETANLFFLFVHDRSALSDWVSMDEKTRWKTFRPLKVREALEAKSLPLPVTHERYSDLSEISVHVTPDTKPNVHHEHQRPSSGGYFKDVSALIALNELAAVVAIAAFAAAQLAELDDAHRKLVSEASHDLLLSVGGVSLATFKDVSLPDPAQ